MARCPGIRNRGLEPCETVMVRGSSLLRLAPHHDTRRRPFLKGICWYNQLSMAKSSTSTNPFRLLREAWAFLRSQPALLHVLLWLMIAPLVAFDALTLYWPQSDVESIRQIGSVGYGLASLLFIVTTFWGLACVLLVGRRMVINRAGRSRTSFRSVRREASALIFPLFFTSLLRSIVTIEWALLALIPGIFAVTALPECRATFSPVLSAIAVFTSTGSHAALAAAVPPFLIRCWPALIAIPLLIPAGIYQIRTAFFGVIVVSENLRYRDALRRSREAVRGKFWKTLWVLAVLAVSIFVPVSVLSGTADAIGKAVLPEWEIIGTVINDVLYASAGLLFTLSLVAFYGKLRKAAGRVQEVVPDIE